MLKSCIVCQKVKSLNDFAKYKSMADGHSKTCKECKRIYDKEYRELNKEKIKKTKEFCRQKRLNYYNNKSKQWSIRNPEQRKRIKAKAYMKKYSTPQGAIEYRMSALIRNCFIRNGSKKNGNLWRKVLGYSVKDLYNHLQSHFLEGMTWELFNGGRIHIDHVIPKSFFVYKSEEDQEFKDCWSLKNLRPIWAIDNWKKSDYMPNGERARNLRFDSDEIAGHEKIKFSEDEIFA